MAIVVDEPVIHLEVCMIVLHNHRWHGPEDVTPEVMDLPEVQWNFWQSRRWPSQDLTDGDTIYCVSGGGPSKGTVMYAATVHNVGLERYRDENHAWTILKNTIPKEVREKSGPGSKSQFLDDYDYESNRHGGWIFLWWAKPTRWIGQPRPEGFRFRQTGYGILDQAPPSWPPPANG